MLQPTPSCGLVLGPPRAARYPTRRRSQHVHPSPPRRGPPRGMGGGRGSPFGSKVEGTGTYPRGARDEKPAGLRRYSQYSQYSLIDARGENVGRVGERRAVEDRVQLCRRQGKDAAAPTSAPGLGSPLSTSAPGLGSPLPTSAPGLGATPPTSAPGPGPPLRRLAAACGIVLPTGA